MANANSISGQIVDAAIAVHSALGPGLLESAYETCLAFELADRGLSVRTQMELPIVYRDVRIDCGYRLDMLVEGQVVVEVKSVAKLLPIHEAQLLTYLKLSGHTVGLLLNFNVNRLVDGLKRMVHRFDDSGRTSS